MPLPDNDLVTGVLGGSVVGGGVLALALKVYHGLKRERTEDAQGDAAFDQQAGIAARLEARVKELEARADKFAEERNGYQVQVGELKSEVRHLTADLAAARERIAHLEGERDAARELLATLQRMYDDFKKQHDELKEENDAMRRDLARFRRSPPAGSADDPAGHVWGDLVNGR